MSKMTLSPIQHDYVTKAEFGEFRLEMKDEFIKFRIELRRELRRDLRKDLRKDLHEDMVSYFDVQFKVQFAKQRELLNEELDRRFEDQRKLLNEEFDRRFEEQRILLNEQSDKRFEEQRKLLNEDYGRHSGMLFEKFQDNLKTSMEYVTAIDKSKVDIEDHETLRRRVDTLKIRVDEMFSSNPFR